MVTKQVSFSSPFDLDSNLKEKISSSKLEKLFHSRPFLRNERSLKWSIWDNYVCAEFAVVLHHAKYALN